ncbi:MAG: hypothetical protein L6Q71_12410 [Planctomycetes bacterium]|nr:hypothetical protein [Planctomycetota bacterium]
MVTDQFALEKFKRVYGQMFAEVKLHKGANGGSEIVAYYNKPHFKHDWVPHTFCRRPVRCVRLAEPQPATPTPLPATSAAK